MPDTEIAIVVCSNLRLGLSQKSCAGSGSLQLLELLQHKIDAQQLPLSLRTRECLGYCEHGPAMRIAPGGAFFQEVTEADLDGILQQALAFAEQLNQA